MIAVLVAEDSRVMRELLVHILVCDPAIRVIATACDGSEAVQMAHRLKPDVITMDIHMPRVGGLEAIRTIMCTCPVPIVIISASMDPGQVGDAFSALEAGAVALCEKPVSPGHPDFEKLSKRIVQTVKMVSEIKVVRRWSPSRPGTPRVPPPAGGRTVVPAAINLVAIGASTGGPPVLQTILAGLPAGFPSPLLIVQHIATGFLQGLVTWLNAASGFPVEIAEDGRVALPGHAYLAPDSVHLEVDRRRRVVLRKGDLVNGMRPSVSVLFRSVSEAFGETAVGILLTGMGRDGADELGMMKDRGAVTIAQDKESSVIHGMPGEAISRGAARYILPPSQIPGMLTTLTERTHG